MPSKSEKAKGILVSLISVYLVQASVSVQKLTVDKGSMHKDVREAFVTRLDNIWKSVLPRQVSSYNDKLYKQITRDLNKQFTTHDCWLANNLGSQLRAIIFNDDVSQGPSKDGDLILFAKVLEFLSASLRYNKTLVVEIVKFISLSDMPLDVRKSINDTILKAMNDFSATVVSHQAKSSSKTLVPGSISAGKIREELEQEFHEVYSALMNEKIGEYKKKMHANIQVLVSRNQELENEVNEKTELITKLRQALEDALEDAEIVRNELSSFGGLRPSKEACLSFGSSLDRLLDEESLNHDDMEEEDDDDDDDENDEQESGEIEFAFDEDEQKPLEEFIEKEADALISEDDDDPISEDDVPISEDDVPISEEEISEEEISEEPYPKPFKATFGRKGFGLGRR